MTLPDIFNITGEKIITNIFYKRINKNISFEIENLRNWLVEQGVRTIIEGYPDKTIQYVMIKDNIIDYINVRDVRLLINDYIRNSDKDYYSVIDSFNNKYSDAKIKETILNLLPEIDLKKINRDEADKFYFYFNNCYVEVTEDNVEIKEYKYLKDKLIWKTQKSDKDFFISDKTSDFEKFIQKAAVNPEQLETAIGYLLHEHKNPSCAKAIILCDQGLEGAQGRCGKSRIGEAIGYMRTRLYMDGKRIDFNNTFLFQNVLQNIRVIEIDDADEDLDFSKFYTKITGNFHIQKKYKSDIIIPFKYSAKFLISTNYMIKTNNELSSIDRILEVMFTNYYRPSYRPIDEFGKLFFIDWDKNDWNNFYNYMIKCCQKYLSIGLIEDTVAILNKRIVKETNFLFFEFMKKEFVFGFEYNKNQFYDNFVKTTDFEVKKNTLTRWLKKYANFLGKEYIQKKYSNDENTFKIE